MPNSDLPPNDSGSPRDSGSENAGHQNAGHQNPGHESGYPENRVRDNRRGDNTDNDPKQTFLIAFAAATALILIAALAFWVLNGDEDEPAETTTTTTEQASNPETSTTNLASPTTAPAGAPVTNRCKASDVEASISEARPSEDRRQFTIALQSRASSPCNLEGFPVIALYNDTDAIPTTSTTEGQSSAKSLQPRQRSTFDVSYPASTDQSCPTATRLFITPPGDSQNVRLPLEGSNISRVCPNTELKVTSFQ